MTTHNRISPSVVRSRLMLETASELAGDPAWGMPQSRVSMRAQGDGAWPVTLFGSDSPTGIQEVIDGESMVAIVNPACVLTLAVRGTGPFVQPVPLRTIAVISSRDQLALAVAERTGVTSLAEVVARRVPLRVSVRGQRDHSIHTVIAEVLKAAGFSLADLESWGGEVHYDPDLPNLKNRLPDVQNGTADAIFEEGVRGWVNSAAEMGMRMLPLEEPVLAKLEQVGFRRSVMPKSSYPAFPADVPTIDFSGFAIFTHADAPDDRIAAFCRALHARRDRIQLQDGSPLPLDRMVRDTPDGPMDVPLHPAAERAWRELGIIHPQIPQISTEKQKSE